MAESEVTTPAIMSKGIDAGELETIWIQSTESLLAFIEVLDCTGTESLDEHNVNAKAVAATLRGLCDYAQRETHRLFDRKIYEREHPTKPWTKKDETLFLMAMVLSGGRECSEVGNG